MAASSVSDSTRFHVPTDDEISKLLSEKDSANTQKSTQLSVRCFRSFLKEKDANDVEFEEFSLDRLNTELKSFYVGARKTDGSYFKKTALQNIRYGLKRYIKEKRKVDILCDKTFLESNEVFKAVATDLKRKGLGTVDHHPPICENDLKKLYSGETPVFDISTPYGLQRKVWFDLTLYLCRRGRENLKEMRKNTFKVATDDVGRKFVFQYIDEMDKNHRLDNENAVTEGSQFCPVLSFSKYISKLNPRKEDLWQRPKDSFSPDDDVWYVNAPLGKKSLSRVMVEISKIGKLSKEYTNHSVRATSITVMDDAGISGRHIVKVSGHSSEASLKHYSRFVSDNKKREMSATLSSALGQTSAPSTGEYEKMPEINAPIAVETMPEVNLDSISEIFSDKYDFEQVNSNDELNLNTALCEVHQNNTLSEIHQNKTHETLGLVQTKNQTDVSNTNTGFLNFRPNFSGHCSVTINIHVNK